MIPSHIQKAMEEKAERFPDDNPPKAWTEQGNYYGERDVSSAFLSGVSALYEHLKGMGGERFPKEIKDAVDKAADDIAGYAHECMDEALAEIASDNIYEVLAKAADLSSAREAVLVEKVKSLEVQLMRSRLTIAEMRSNSFDNNKEWNGQVKVLRDENERLREALAQVRVWVKDCQTPSNRIAVAVENTAREALGAEGGK